jgi:hypothetical protein
MNYLRKIVTSARICRNCGEPYLGDCCDRSSKCAGYPFDDRKDLCRPYDVIAVFDGSNPLLFEPLRHFLCSNSLGHYHKLEACPWRPETPPGRDSEPWQNIFVGAFCPLCRNEGPARSTLIYSYTGEKANQLLSRDEESEDDDAGDPADRLDWDYLQTKQGKEPSNEDD